MKQSQCALEGYRVHRLTSRRPQSTDLRRICSAHAAQQHVARAHPHQCSQGAAAGTLPPRSTGRPSAGAA